MQLSSRTSSCVRSYTVDGITLSAVGSVRDLGFHYDNKLNFSEHIRRKVNMAQLRTYQIFKGLNIANEKALLLAYKAYVRPLVESSTTVFNPLSKRHIYALERVQNNFTRKLLIRVNGYSYSKIPSAATRNKHWDCSLCKQGAKFLTYAWYIN